MVLILCISYGINIEEKGKWVKVTGWEGVDSAKKIIESSITNAKNEKKAS